MSKIREIWGESGERYGVRKVWAELWNRGVAVNYKKVARIMRKNRIKGAARKAKRYSSYKGTVGKIAKNELKCKLLSDSDHTLMEQVGAWGKKMMYGKEVEGTIRSTFIIGKDGKVEACWYKVKVDGHADTVYSTVKSLMQ